VRRVVLAVAGLVAVAVVITTWRLSALPVSPSGRAPLPGTSVPLAFHVHTTRSDGTGTVDEVAAAAAAAGLRALVLTDHGDGTRPPDPPRYLHGVLVLDGVEISSWGGHYIAVGARPSRYPLGGAPDSVVEDVARLGGLGIVAHPGSSRDELRWRDWDAAFDGLEWLNADSEWRDRPRDLWSALVTYPWRAPVTIASLLHRPAFELREWDRRTAQRPIVGLAAHDAHARLGLRGASEPYDGWVALGAPGYQPMFRAFSNVVQLSRPLDGDAGRDADAVLEALQRGSVYAIVQAGEAPPDVRFTASSGDRVASIGQHLIPVGPTTWASLVDAPDTATSTLVCDGRPVRSVAGGRLVWTTDTPGACRLEVVVHGSDWAPWVVTNPIYVRPTLVTSAPSTLGAPRVIVPIAGSGSPDGWTAETAPDSTATLADGDTRGRVRLAWQLGSGREAFTAIRVATPPALRDFDRLIVRASTDRPMRVWVQLRTPADGGRRWGRSVYLDATPREVALPLLSFMPLDATSAPDVPLDQVSALLLVIDTVHARPGDRGTLTFDELRVGQ
jgi:hypothetical protein